MDSYFAPRNFPTIALQKLPLSYKQAQDYKLCQMLLFKQTNLFFNRMVKLKCFHFDESEPKIGNWVYFVSVAECNKTKSKFWFVTQKQVHLGIFSSCVWIVHRKLSSAWKQHFISVIY